MFDSISTRSKGEIRAKIDLFMLWSSLSCSVFILFLIGYNTDPVFEAKFYYPIDALIYLYELLLVIKIVITLSLKSAQKLSFYSELALFIYLTLVIFASLYPAVVGFQGLADPVWLYVGIYAVFIVEVSKTSLFFDKFYFNPTLLFVVSFLLLILLGTVLLLLPRSTTLEEFSFIDALFMSTSAVCVTGLSITDISTNFSTFGQNVILLMVQLGGLGIMTFTGFFGYFFTGGFSYKNQLMYTEFLNENKVSSVIRTLYTIVGITFLFEGVGAVFIFFSLETANFKDIGEQIHFAVFHAISGFCNAGFSTLSNGLYEKEVRFNYNLQLIVAFLLIMGGLGFALVHNVYGFFNRWYYNLYNRFLYRQPILFKPWVMSFNSKVVLYTTAILITFGTLICFVLEYNNTMAEHPTLWGKFVTAFFMGVTPRTAGFNTVNMTALGFPVIILTIVLMWIGASPGSTGGGIKTTTFAIAMLNIYSIARGRDRVEIFKRELSDDTTKRAFAIIALSLLLLGVAIFLLSITDGDKGLQALAFEAFSAFATVGLSLGITPGMSSGGKLVLIATMFIGRVGTLTLLIALIKKPYVKNYHYPKEDMTF